MHFKVLSLCLIPLILLVMCLQSTLVNGLFNGHFQKTVTCNHLLGCFQNEVFWLYFLEQFKVHSKVEWKVQSIAVHLTHCPPCCYPHQRTHLLDSVNLLWHTHHCQRLWLTLVFTLGVVHSMGFDKCNVTSRNYLFCVRNVGTSKRSLFIFLDKDLVHSAF